MILSHFHTAEDIATQMSNASDSIQHAISKSYSADNRTTLTINSKAQEANNQAIELANLFNEAFQTTIKNIHSAAAEFQRLDHEIGTKINQSLMVTELLKDTNTYMKAKNG
jgi:type VII secretion effector (TIGR04197 family)